MIVALAQMDVRLGDRAGNLERATQFVGEAAARGAALVVLPELWSTGYDLTLAASHASANRTLVLPAIAAAAREHRVHVVGSLLLPGAAGGVCNTAVLHGPDGSVRAEYEKIHLFGLMAEDRHLVGGNATPLAPVADWTAAMAICYDLRFPELFRTYALAGATLFLVPAEWPAVRLDHWRTLARARAIENQCFVVACNRCGTSADTTFGGHSMVVDPWGRVLTEGEETETLLVTGIELARVTEARAQMDILGDRRPTLYDMHSPLATTP